MVPARNFPNCLGVNPHHNLSILAVVFTAGSCLDSSCNEEKGANPDSTMHELTGSSLGDQVWSAANLDVSRFRNGDLIPNMNFIRDHTIWTARDIAVAC